MPAFFLQLPTLVQVLPGELFEVRTLPNETAEPGIHDPRARELGAVGVHRPAAVGKEANSDD